MITVPVTCTASDQNGNPVAGSVVTAKLNQTEVYLGLIVPESITAVANASGVAVLNLWPNALGVNGSMYRITATNPDTGRKYLDTTVSVPNSACNLHQIMTVEPYPAIDASAQALAAAQGALALVTAQAGIATTQATNATTSAGSAATSATNAGASATAASGSAGTAANSASTAATSAGTSMTQAGIATLWASESATSAATAFNQAQTATAQAVLSMTSGQAQVSLATAQVALAATQANNAAGSASNSTTSANAASNSASTATTQASNAATSATNAAASATTATTQATNAQAAATTATTKASEAATSATTATTQASTATTQASNAATSATNAANSATAANTSAGTASTAATTATTQAGNASSSATAAGTSATQGASSATASALSATNASTSQTSATASATLSTTNANTATTQNTASGTSASAAAASATASAAARDLSIAAWAASTAPAETLAAMSQSIHVGAVVKAIIYDTSKDSDGGIWRKRCTDKSWFTEALGGTAWLATKCADEATARAVIQSAKSPELVTNGTFDTGVAGWTFSNCTGAMVSGQLVLTSTVASGSVSATFAGVTTVGKTYYAAFTCVARSGVTGGQAYVGGAVASNFSGNDTYFGWANSTSATQLFSLNLATTGVGQTAVFDNISVKLADSAVSAAGYVYQTTATGSKYFSLTGTTGQTEVFRGIVSEFPAKVAVVAESARVVIYDLSTGAMWMVFTNGAAGFLGAPYYFSGGAQTGLAAANGKLFQSSTGAGITTIDFLTDSANLIGSSDARKYNNAISGRNANGGSITFSTVRTVSHTSNDVAVTVLENAPIDPATGLPVPTVAVATAGGVSVIKQDGTVVNSSSTSSMTAVDLTSGLLRYCFGSNLGYAGSVAKLVASFQTVGIIGASNYWDTTQFGVTLGAQRLAAGLYGGSTTGLVVSKQNLRNWGAGMVAAITNAYNSGWQVGDSRFCGLADVVAETITAPELVVNGTFNTDTTGWASGNAATLASIGGELEIKSTGLSYGQALATAISVTIGKTYTVTWRGRRGTDNSGWMLIGSSPSSRQDYAARGLAGTTNQEYTQTLTPTTTLLYLTGQTNNTIADATIYFDNVSCKQVDADRSVKANGLSIVGSLTKTAVALGAQLVSYSGFSAANYLEQPYSANLDFGTGDFCVMGWVNLSNITTSQTLFDRGGGGSGRIGLVVAASAWFVSVSATSASAGSIGVAPSIGLAFVTFYRESGVLKLSVNGAQVYSASNTANVSNASAPLKVGLDYTGGASMLGSLALLRISATAPSADQIAQIYRDELALFAPGAQCTLAGTSTAVTALAYDESTDLLHVGTSWGRSDFKSLLRTASEATTTGSITSLSASQGTIVTGGTSAKIYQPALQLRDELARREEARRALGKVPVFIDFTATASQTAFVLAKGYTVKALYRNGTLMRETTTGVFWTRSNDGYQETATLSVGATVGDWISLMCIRSN